MKKSRKISFLIAAHNEEKIIGKALKCLTELPYPNYEVIIGLDGCTDKTLDIVKYFQRKKPKIFKYIELNERKGKAHVVNLIFPYSRGEIIIIHDADWILKINRKDDLIKIISWFDDPKLGGIAESFPVEWEPERIKTNNSMAFLAIAWTSYFWIEYLKKKFSIRINGNLYTNPENKNFPFELNIMRRKLYNKNETLGDAWERAQDVLEQKYLLRLVEDQSLPRMHASYHEARFKDIFKQKIRTAISREQIKQKYPYLNFNFFNFHFPLLLFLLKNLYMVKRIKAVFGVFIWLVIMTYSILLHEIKRLNANIKQGWITERYRQGTYKSWVLRAKRTF